MPAIMTIEFASRSLGDFIDTVKLDKKLFLGLGKRSTTWTGSPDQLTNTVQEKLDFWDELLGVKKLAIKDIIPMIPERRWQSGLTYVEFDSTSDTAFDDSFYVANTLYEVFVCTVAGGGASTTEPKLEDCTDDGNGNWIVVADGYTWTYQYKANSYEYQQTPTGWMSVNYGSSLDTSDLKQNSDAFVQLGTRYLLVRVEVKDPDISGEFSAGAFRQVGLISHPRLTDGSLVINTYEPLANLKDDSGYLIYLENREQEDVISGQNTDLKITLRF